MNPARYEQIMQHLESDERGTKDLEEISDIAEILGHRIAISAIGSACVNPEIQKEEFMHVFVTEAIAELHNAIVDVNTQTKEEAQ